MDERSCREIVRALAAIAVFTAGTILILGTVLWFIVF